jgi:hypothetical protein
MATDIYLAGEEHHVHQYRLAEIYLIKQLIAKNAITALSLEIEFDKYQHLLDSFVLSGSFGIFADSTPLIYLAKKNNLDVLASDYRKNTLVGHMIMELRKLDDASGAPDSEKEVRLLSYIKPLVFANPAQFQTGDNMYSRFCKNLDLSRDFYDFLGAAYYEERDRFTFNYLSSYMKRKPGSHILHICGLRHIASLAGKFIKAGNSLEVIDLLAIQKS